MKTIWYSERAAFRKARLDEDRAHLQPILCFPDTSEPQMPSWNENGDSGSADTTGPIRPLVSESAFELGSRTSHSYEQSAYLGVLEGPRSQEGCGQDVSLQGNSPTSCMLPASCPELGSERAVGQKIR